MKSCIPISVLLFSIALPALQAFAESPTAEDMKAAFSGYQREGLSRNRNPMTTKFNPDGTVDWLIEGGKFGVVRIHGSWRIQGSDTLCVEEPVGTVGGGTTCTRYEKDGGNLYAVDDQGKRKSDRAIPIRK